MRKPLGQESSDGSCTRQTLDGSRVEPSVDTAVKPEVAAAVKATVGCHQSSATDSRRQLASDHAIGVADTAVGVQLGQLFVPGAATVVSKRKLSCYEN